MTESFKYFLLVIGGAGFAGAAISMLLAIYFLRSMMANFRREKRLLLTFAAPVAIVLPQFWTDEGNKYRKKFLLSVVAFGVFACIPLICKSLVP
jgi:hypothetical protein